MKREPGTPKASWLDRIRKPGAFIAIGAAAFSLAACGPDKATADKAPTVATSTATPGASETSTGTPSSTETETAAGDTIAGIDVSDFDPAVVKKLEGLTPEKVAAMSPDEITAAFYPTIDNFLGTDAEVANKRYGEYVPAAALLAILAGIQTYTDAGYDSDKVREISEDIVLPAFDGIIGKNATESNKDAIAQILTGYIGQKVMWEGLKQSLSIPSKDRPSLPPLPNLDFTAGGFTDTHKGEFVTGTYNGTLSVTAKREGDFSQWNNATAVVLPQYVTPLSSTLTINVVRAFRAGAGGEAVEADQDTSIMSGFAAWQSTNAG